MSGYTYEQVRDIIQDGDVIFFHGDWSNPLHAVIMFFTCSPFSHCATAFWNESQTGRRLMVVESQGGSKRRMSPLSFYADRIMTIVPGLKPWGDVADFALGRIGEAEYSWSEAIYVGVRDFLKTYFETSIPKYSSEHETCSEFIAEMYGIPDKRVSPQGLYDELIKISEARTVTGA